MEKRELLGQCSLKCQKDGHLEDLISQMPDIILANILSLLEMREAGRSSVLSHRWKDLWKLTTVLNFDYSEILRLLAGVKRKRKSARSKYIRWVDQVIALHQWPSLDKFRVTFDFSDVFNSSVDEWLKFSIRKGAKRIEIDINEQRYTPSQECYAWITSPSNKSNLKRLTSLFLRYVNINGQFLEYVLRNCPLLENVIVWRSNHLVDLHVVGPSLKHLGFHNCSLMESLELFEAPKLRTLEYFGKKLRLLSVGNLPLLSNIYLGTLGDQINYALLPCSMNFSQLETLKLSMAWKGNEEIPDIPELTNLKILKLNLVINSGRCLLNLSKLIEAAPALHEFTMEMLWDVVHPQAPTRVCNPRPRRCLKHVEILGFSGAGNEKRFIEYLLKCATDVQMVIIDPNDTGQPEAEWNKSMEKLMALARSNAWKLRRLVPPGANFIVK